MVAKTEIKRAEGRAAKKAAKEATQQAALEQANKEALRAQPTAEEQVAAAQAKAATKQPKLSRAQRTRLAHKAAEEQAKRDALLKPQPVEDNVQVGETPPLHILNQRAAQAQADIRDEAMEIGKAVGGVARDLVIGRAPRLANRGNRHRRMAEFDERMRVTQAAAKTA